MTACRFCKAHLSETLVDLGATPLANAYLPCGDPSAVAAEQTFPLRVMLCTECWLVQTSETVDASNIFRDDYAYHSSYAKSWVDHARHYAEDMTERYGLGPRSQVVEVASNDGYLLQHFVDKGIPSTGVEPAGRAAAIAESRGVPTHVAFFNTEMAEKMATQGQRADLIVANNVLAHVPDIRDFANGFRTLLKPGGVATFEFPHLANLIEQVQFAEITRRFEQVEPVYLHFRLSHDPRLLNAVHEAAHDQHHEGQHYSDGPANAPGLRGCRLFIN